MDTVLTSPLPASTGGVQVPTARIAEQSITAFALAEIITDSDSGEPTLCISSDQHLSDYQAATAGQAAALAQQLRAKADQIEALANEYAERVVLPAFISEYRIELEEWDVSTLDPMLREHLRSWRMTEGDHTVVIVPTGQSPIERLAAVADVVRSLDRQEAK
ncbi:hypothetical protein GFH48_18955 [Streptomyces fagopyri]|uniref:Uncharacterized protein n=1 Tax=Streptomyces fagopyri TaxID=2662397 RepID=A0A5Q0LEY3_9ACTN|nr:hypothetical protein [Streptomyces fagopyri]QFZ75069.1 hypothetical protein GFH48_18955 [Streptomyces fagopyri]